MRKSLTAWSIVLCLISVSTVFADQSSLDMARDLIDKQIAILEDNPDDTWSSINAKLTELGGSDIFVNLSESEREEVNKYVNEHLSDDIDRRITVLEKEASEDFSIQAESAEFMARRRCPDWEKTTQCIGIHLRCCNRNVGAGMCFPGWGCRSGHFSKRCDCPPL